MDPIRKLDGSRVMRDFDVALARIASSDATVLLDGESGAGKGYWARILHARSPRADRPFVQVDCGQLSPNTIESDLFGHERGAFTSAHARRRGHFEMAHGGTLFLDEIGELPLDLQPKLLRAIEEQRFARLGGTKTIQVNVRIVVATSRDLSEEVARGRFREDLYFRLRVVELRVPALRERRRDIARLVDELVPELCRKNRRTPVELTPRAHDALLAHDWPGNVRTLKNTLERAIVLGDGPTLDAEDFDLPTSATQPPAPHAMSPTITHARLMEHIERERLLAAMHSANGNQSAAARALGLSRMTFVNKLKRHNLV